MTPKTRHAVEQAAGRAVCDLAALSGGSVGQVYKVTLDDGSAVVAKIGPGLEPEGWMLRFLADHSRLPVPRLLFDDDDLLVMEFVDGRNGLGGTAQVHAAELLADLHAITAPAFGLERPTVIGGLPQPNPWTPRWLDFFRDQRLLYMAGKAHRAGRLPASLLRRIETLAGRLPDWIEEPAQPSLVHGDCWAGNMLYRDGRVTAFIDPALYYADPEVDLAFGTLFGTFDDTFFRRYAELHPLRPGYFEVRRDLYNLYPLLVHVRLFGDAYVGQVEAVVRRFE